VDESQTTRQAVEPPAGFHKKIQAGFHKKKNLKGNVSAGQLRAADLVDMQGSTLLRASEQGIQGTD
jgi:hypothetical protein